MMTKIQLKIVALQLLFPKMNPKDESGIQEPIGILLMVGLTAVAALIVVIVWFGAYGSLLTEPTLFAGTASAYNIGGNDSEQGISLFFSQGDALSFQDTLYDNPTYITLMRPDGNQAALTYGNGTERFEPGDTLYITTLSQQNVTYLLTDEQPVSGEALENGTWKLTLVDDTLDVPLLSATIEITGNTTAEETVPIISGFSVESWIWWNKNPAPASTDEKWATIVVKGDADHNRKYHLQHDSDNSNFEFAAASNDGPNSGKFIFSSTNPQKETWYHVTGIYDQTDGTVAIYVNGNREASTTLDTSGLRSSAGPYQTGSPDGITFNGKSNVRRFDGTISGLKTYGRRLTDDEIAAHAAAGHP